MASQSSTTVDPDRQCVVDGLHEALRHSGLSQASFARALGTSASRFSTYLSGSTSPSAALFFRARRLGLGLRVAGQLNRMTPASTAAVVRAALNDGDEAWAMAMVLQGRDDLRALLDQRGAGADAWECDPGPLGQPAFDALLRALIAHEFTLAGRDEPRWTRPGAELGSFVFPSPYYDEHEIRRRTPNWLAERGVYLVERDLETA